MEGVSTKRSTPNHFNLSAQNRFASFLSPGGPDDDFEVDEEDGVQMGADEEVPEGANFVNHSPIIGDGQDDDQEEPNPVNYDSQEEMNTKERKYMRESDEETDVSGLPVSFIKPHPIGAKSIQFEFKGDNEQQKSRNLGDNENLENEIDELEKQIKADEKNWQKYGKGNFENEDDEIQSTHSEEIIEQDFRNKLWTQKQTQFDFDNQKTLKQQEHEFRKSKTNSLLAEIHATFSPEVQSKMADTLVKSKAQQPQQQQHNQNKIFDEDSLLKSLLFTKSRSTPAKAQPPQQQQKDGIDPRNREMTTDDLLSQPESIAETPTSKQNARKKLTSDEMDEKIRNSFFQTGQFSSSMISSSDRKATATTTTTTTTKNESKDFQKINASIQEKDKKSFSANIVSKAPKKEEDEKTRIKEEVDIEAIEAEEEEEELQELAGSQSASKSKPASGIKKYRGFFDQRKKELDELSKSISTRLQRLEELQFLNRIDFGSTPLVEKEQKKAQKEEESMLRLSRLKEQQELLKQTFSQPSSNSILNTTPSKTSKPIQIDSSFKTMKKSPEKPQEAKLQADTNFDNKFLFNPQGLLENELKALEALTRRKMEAIDFSEEEKNEKIPEKEYFAMPEQVVPISKKQEKIEKNIANQKTLDEEEEELFAALNTSKNFSKSSQPVRKRDFMPDQQQQQEKSDSSKKQEFSSSPSKSVLNNSKRKENHSTAVNRDQSPAEQFVESLISSKRTQQQQQSKVEQQTQKKEWNLSSSFLIDRAPLKQSTKAKEPTFDEMLKNASSKVMMASGSSEDQNKKSSFDNSNLLASSFLLLGNKK